MRKNRNILILLFFLILNFFNAQLFSEKLDTACAIINDSNNIELTIKHGKENFVENLYFFDKNINTIKKEIYKKNDLKKTINLLKNMGFSNEEISIYLFPTIEKIYFKLNNKFLQEEIDDEIFVVKNTCKINIHKGHNGRFIDKEAFYSDFISQLIDNNRKVNITLREREYKNKIISKDEFLKISEFSTEFSSSSEERKNNIRVALERFDGIILEEGEVLSFNSTTGDRNKQSGYLPAKIISGGTFIEGYGGGVCQVSTTIYNASLLAGLEILEVHSHSLPVSYVEPCFDAMVNSGTSDLIIKNNTKGKIIITTSSKNSTCKVTIFGKECEYKIKRISEKTKTIPSDKDDVIETDYKKYGLNNLEIGEEKKISYAKDGFSANGYLQYYDKNGKLIKTKKIRESIYNPTRGVVVRKEN